MNKSLIAAGVMTALVGAFAIAPSPAAASWFSSHHPRRAAVDRRERTQQERIARGIHSGRLNPQEAQQLEAQERTLRQQERTEVRANGGSLTKAQARQLNHEEDTLSHEIYQDEHN